MPAPAPRTTMARTAAAVACVALPALATGASGGTIRIEVDGLRSDEGLLRAAVCSRDEFLSPDCSFAGAGPAEGAIVTIPDVPPGTWAVQVFHDEDGDGDFDRRGLRPLEGLGFSRNARMRLGPPRFRDAAFGLEGDAVVRLRMRYFQ